MTALLLSLASLPCLAPVPRDVEPRSVQEIRFTGEWDYEYGSMRRGWILFTGSEYDSQHDPTGDYRYAGKWYATRANEFVLIENGTIYAWRITKFGRDYAEGVKTDGADTPLVLRRRAVK